MPVSTADWHVTTDTAFYSADDNMLSTGRTSNNTLATAGTHCTKVLHTNAVFARLENVHQ